MGFGVYYLTEVTNLGQCYSWIVRVCCCVLIDVKMYDGKEAACWIMG